jgi:hypothetical protein
MLEATLSQRMGLVALVATAAVATAWFVLPEAFPTFRQQRPASEYLAARPSPAIPSPRPGRPPPFPAPERRRPGSTSPGSGPAACW